jgi:hypothetical protein
MPTFKALRTPHESPHLICYETIKTGIVIWPLNLIIIHTLEDMHKGAKFNSN